MVQRVIAEALAAAGERVAERQDIVISVVPIAISSGSRRQGEPLCSLTNQLCDFNGKYPRHLKCMEYSFGQRTG
jgi:hypothetical protein